jgi:hypothetical protein
VLGRTTLADLLCNEEEMAGVLGSWSRGLVSLSATKNEASVTAGTPTV